MAVSAFLSDDTGYAELLGKKDWTTDSIYVALIKTAATITRGSQTWASIKANKTDPQLALPTPTVAVSSTKVKFSHAKVQFTSDGSLSGRYVFYLFGDYSSPQDADKVIGYVDLDGSGDVSSVNAEFSFTPDSTNGLFEIARSAGA